MLLPSLHISNFRRFSSLHMERLGRINLIVGKNNVGKSSLLEAVYLYGHGGEPSAFLDILANRRELRTYSDRSDISQEEDPANAVARFFHGAYTLHDATAHTIQIGANDSESLKVALAWYLRSIPEKDPVTSEVQMVSTVSDPVLVISAGGPKSTGLQVDRLWEMRYRRQLRLLSKRRPERSNIPSCLLVPPSGVEDSKLGALWDSIVATDQEEDVIDALRLIDDRVERLYFVGHPDRAQERFAVVKLTGIAERVPLRNLGDGMNRFLGIILALAKAKGGALLIDEVENGIHYSVQSELFRLLFQMAGHLDVQIFATTHSWDCIQAFQEAAANAVDHEGYLVRLHADGENVSATVFDEEKLAVITRQEIEVR